MDTRALSALGVLILLGGGVASTTAQELPTDHDAPQVVGLFEQACLRFAGNVSGLRSWIATHHLPPVPVTQAAAFLGHLPGLAFGASTATGKHALVSYDDGACQVIALSDNLSAVEQALIAMLHTAGVSLSPIVQRSKPDGSATQKIFSASASERRWTISITTHPHRDMPSLAPELHLMATVGAPKLTGGVNERPLH